MSIPEYISLAQSTESDYRHAGEYICRNRDAFVRFDFKDRPIRLLHAAIGMSTEAFELGEIRDRQNLKEELGDFLWYCAIASGDLWLNGNMPDSIVIEGSTEGLHEISTLKSIANRRLDQTKKAIFYGFNDKFSESAHLGGWRSDMMVSFACTGGIAIENGWSLSEIMESNIAKLKARYPNKFSTESAHSRNIETELSAVGQ